MENYVSEQLLLFLQAILMGAALALVYDLLGVLRSLGGRLWGGALDVLFCLSSLAAVFVFVMAGSGELRVFVVVGIGGGAVLFWGLLAGLLRPIWTFWLQLVLLPAAWMKRFLKKCGRKTKKVCTFWKNWFTMKLITFRRKRPAEKQEGDEGMAASSGGKAARPSQNKPKPVKSPSGKLTMFLLLILAAFISVQIFHMFDQLQTARQTEEAYAQQLAELQETNQQLQEDLDNSDSLDLIEDIARDQLGMVQEGEKVFHYSK